MNEGTKERKYELLKDMLPTLIEGKPFTEAKCEKCGEWFSIKEILMEAVNNIQFTSCGVKSYNNGGNNYYLISPCCEHPHLFGFVLK